MMQKDNVILLAAAGVAAYLVYLASQGSTPATSATATASGSGTAPAMFGASAGQDGWVQSGNTMYSPDGWYYTYNGSTWTVVGQWDPASGKKLN